jgi:hypothetical protein
MCLGTWPTTESHELKILASCVVGENDKIPTVKTGTSQRIYCRVSAIDHSRANKKKSLKHLACSRHAYLQKKELCHVWHE